MGFAEKDMLDKNISHFVSKDSLKKLNEQFQLAKNSQLKQFQELNLLNNKGELFPVDASFSFVTYSGDKNNKIFFHGKNSNIKTKPSDYSIPNENKYSNLLENLDLGVMEVDMNDTILWANKRFEKISGYTSQEIKDKKAIDLFISSAAEKNKMNIQILKRAENKHTVYEIKIKRKDGEMIDLIISGSPITDKEGKVIGSLGIHWDVTQIRKKEREIEWEKISRERETLNITISAEEKQREIISQELHDGVGQTLAFTNLFIQKAMNSDKISPDLCMKVQEKLNEALNEVRRISRNLKPYGLNELGLEDAIFELLNQYRLHKKTVFLLKSKSSDFKEIGFEVQRSIYLIVQELVKNAIAYANATAVSFQFKRTESKLVLTYQDNGNGFNPKKATTGLGLKKVNSRVDLYEGKINIDSFPKKGTDIRIEFPLNKITEQ